MANIAIIPARGGSKRILKKNIKEFLGKPIIAYSIEAALLSGLFEEVMVSTDDPEIAEVALKYGASIPFFRSAENSDDFTGPGDVVFEVLQDYSKNKKYFDTGCCILATAPLLTIKSLIDAFDLLQNREFDTIFPITKYTYPIWRSYKKLEEGFVAMNFPEYERTRSQDLQEAYHDAGQFYWFYTEKIISIENKNLFGSVKGTIEISATQVQDIDTLDDWILAEVKAQYFNKIK